MTKKQLKQLAKQLAECEHIIQTSDDPIKVNSAKNRTSQLSEAADLSLDDMIKLDEMIRDLLKNI